MGVMTQHQRLRRTTRLLLLLVAAALGEKAPQVPTRQMRLTPWRENSSVA